MEEWIPKEILADEEFLPEEFKPLRDYVLRTRSEDISLSLHVYEERVLLPLYLSVLKRNARQVFSWETVRCYEYECVHRGKIQIVPFRIEKRTVKRHFLRAWMEIRLWDNGLHQTQLIHSPPDDFQLMNISPDHENQFIHGESVRYSIVAMRNFWDKYLNAPPKKRGPRPRIFHNELAKSASNKWGIHVLPELKLYYDGDESVQTESLADFPPLFNMPTINFLKDTESSHASIANYDSWQAFLHQFMNKDKPMKTTTTLLELYQSLLSAADSDDCRLTPELAQILATVASGNGVAGLDEHDREIAKRTAEASPAFHLMLRSSQLNAIRKKVAKGLYEKSKADEPASVPGQDQRLAARCLNSTTPRKRVVIDWLSSLWEPLCAGQPVTAADIPDQEQIFSSQEGEIKIICGWEDQYHNDPSFIRLNWEADLTSERKLWIRFQQPDSAKILHEVCLGTIRTGEEVFTSNELGFDPVTIRWALTIGIESGDE